MTVSFPTALDVLSNPTSSDTLASVSHSSQHANLNDAVEALQAKVGANSSAVTTSLDYLLRHIDTTWLPSAITISGALAAVAATLTSVTNSALTSGRVTLASTGGLLADSAGLFYASSVLTVGDQSANATLILDGATSTARAITFRTAGSTRWQMRATNIAEGGADAGSGFALQAFSDAAASIDTPISIARIAGGAMTLTRPVSITSSTDSTTTATGALIVTGGIGVAKRITLDGATGKTLRITNATASAAVAVTLGSVGPTGSTAGNPQGWMRVDIAGTDRYIPFW